MKNTYFISDIHLGFKNNEHEERKRKKLTEFLEYIRTRGEARTLFLVGDIFDFWFEWYHVVPKYWFPVFFELKKTIECGIEVVFITGNHDFHFGSYLEKDIGIRCFDESYQFECQGKQFYVAHGDGLAKKDYGYRLLKKIIRNPVSIFLFKTFISADLGMLLAKWTSHSSRQLVHIEKPCWAEEYYAFAQQKFDQGMDFVIVGHIHYPILREDKEKAFLNCGDWMNFFTYGKFDGEKLTLEKWQ